MAVTYTTDASAAAVKQVGASTENTPEGLQTLTLVYRGKPSVMETWAASISRGDACAETGYTSLTAVATPRLSYDGAFATGYVVYQGAPSSEGTSESDLDVDYTSEVRTIVLNLSTSGALTYELSYTSPIITAAYIAGSKPGSFRFASLIAGEDPVQVSATPIGASPARTGEFEEPGEIKIKTESKFVERRNVGGIWHCTEQHSKVIVNLDGSA